MALDGEVLSPSLDLGGAVRGVVADGDHLVEFTAAGTEASVTVSTIDALVAVVLMGGDAPTSRLYPHNPAGAGGADIKIINAVPDRRLAVSLSGGGVGLSATLDFTASSHVAAPGGTYSLTVSDDTDQPMEPGSVMLRNGRSFVIIHPGADGSLRVLVF